MHTLLIIIGVNAATVGSAFLLAGWFSLAAPSEGETEDVRRSYDTARQKGWIQAQLFVMSLRYEGTNPRRIADHWSARPHARKLIYIGVGSMMLAVLIGFSLGAFN